MGWTFALYKELYTIIATTISIVVNYSKRKWFSCEYCTTSPSPCDLCDRRRWVMVMQLMELPNCGWTWGRWKFLHFLEQKSQQNLVNSRSSPSMRSSFGRLTSGLPPKHHPNIYRQIIPYLEKLWQVCHCNVPEMFNRGNYPKRSSFPVSFYDVFIHSDGWWWWFFYWGIQQPHGAWCRSFFLRAQEVRQRSFLWWCAPSNKDYNTADEDQKDKIIQDLWHRGKTCQRLQLANWNITIW